GRLRDWPGLEARLTPERASALAMRLRADAHRIAQATRASLPQPDDGDEASLDAQAGVHDAAAAEPATGPALESGASELQMLADAHRTAQATRAGLPQTDDGDEASLDAQAGVHDAAAAEPATGPALEIGADELQMLAEAAEQLDEEFRDALAGAADFDSFAQIGDAVERYATAIAYVGLVAVSDALFAWHRNFERFARAPESFAAAHRALLARLPSRWATLFRSPSIDAARDALAPLAD